MDLDAGTEEAFLSVFGADLLAGWTGLADFEAGMQKPQVNKAQPHTTPPQVPTQQRPSPRHHPIRQRR